MTAEERRAAADRFLRASGVPDADVDDLYAAGRLNDVIVGAISVTLRNMGYPADEIDRVTAACQHDTFDLCNAADLRRAARDDR